MAKTTEHTDYLEEIVNLQGGWSESDGAIYGEFTRFGADRCLWSFVWQFPGSDFPGVKQVTPDMMQPIDVMNDNELLLEIGVAVERCLRRNWLLELGQIAQAMHAGLCGKDWQSGARIFLSRVRGGYPCHSSKQASWQQGVIRAQHNDNYSI
jgi:hypothetical protein